MFLNPKSYESLERLYQLVKSNPCLSSHKTCGEHSLTILPRNSKSPRVAMTIHQIRVEIEASFPDLAYEWVNCGLKVSVVDYSQIFSD